MMWLDFAVVFLTYWSLTLHSNPLCLGSAFVVGLEVASATARSTRYAERSPSDRGLGLDPINCTTYFTAQHCKDAAGFLKTGPALKKPLLPGLNKAEKVYISAGV